MNHHAEHKNFNMKRTLIGLVIVSFFAWSCGNTHKDNEGAINDKKAELQKLKEEQKKLNEKNNLFTIR